MRLDIRFLNPLTLRCDQPAPPSGSVTISATLDGFTAKGSDMAYTLPADKQVTLKVEFLDAKGNHATVDGDLGLVFLEPEVATATAAPGNPYIAQLMPVAPGSCQVVVEADADTGDGVKEVVCTMDVEVVGGEAGSGRLA